MSRPLYLDPQAPVDVRVEDLLERMTLEEKIAQLQNIGVDYLVENHKLSEEKAGKFLKNGIGGVRRVAGSRLRLKPREVARVVNEIQRYLATKTRLGIPAIIHEVPLAGIMGTTATIFPQIIGLGSTWDPELIYRVASAIRRQMRIIGARLGLVPGLDVIWDPRWGRTEESFGEDPYLVAVMGLNYIEGLQGEDLREGVAACPKHFAGHGYPEGGRNTAPVYATPRVFREVFLFPFEVAVKVGNAYSVMPAYHEIDGIPCHASKWLLTDILIKEWGFKGFTISDYAGIEQLATIHRIARDLKEAAILALEAGVHQELKPLPTCYGEPLLQAVREGLIDESIVDEAVRRILRVKFMLGLFENPYVNIDEIPEELDSPEDRALALEAARKSIILLKNNGVLPLRKDMGSIAVIGPIADSRRDFLGDYHYEAHVLPTEQPSVRVVTVLEGIKKKVSEKTKIYYARGCDIVRRSDDFDRALEIAEEADVVVLILGERSGLSNKWYGKTVYELQHLTGEGNDSHDLRLPRVQEELLEEVVKRVGSRKPVILVLVNGRPLDISSFIDRVSAVIEAWLPGEEGGTAIADVIFGDYNPGGKLPISWPKHAGQIPVYYYRKPSSLGSYVFLDSEPLFPFGHGLSYTEFRYDSLEITPAEIPPMGSVRISFTVENIGRYDGDEVAQLYISKDYASVARPEMELKGFKRIHLKRGEKKRVTFILPAEILAFYDRDMKLVVEPGTYRVMVGSSSKDIRLKGEFRVKERREITQRSNYFSQAIAEN